jgi:hypothetical protein
LEFKFSTFVLSRNLKPFLSASAANLPSPTFNNDPADVPIMPPGYLIAEESHGNERNNTSATNRKVFFECLTVPASSDFAHSSQPLLSPSLAVVSRSFDDSERVTGH